MDFWQEPHELCTKVVIAITQAIHLAPGVGWIRGDQAIDPKVLQEMERVRSENESLKQRLKEYDSEEVKFPSHLAGPDSCFELKFYAGSRTPEKASASYKYDITWREIFLASIDPMLVETGEIYIADGIAKLAASKAGIPKATGVVADAQDIRRIRFHLEALGLIQAVARTKTSDGRSYTMTTWELTEKGRRYVSENLAQRAPKQALPG